MSHILTGNNISRTVDPEVAKEFEWAQKSAAHVSTVYNVVAGVLGLLTIIPIGFFSDRKGRKMAIILTWTGTFLEILINCKMLYMIQKGSHALLGICMQNTIKRRQF